MQNILIQSWEVGPDTKERKGGQWLLSRQSMVSASLCMYDM